MSVTDGWHYWEKTHSFQHCAIVVIADVNIADVHVIVDIIDTYSDNAFSKGMLHGEVRSDVEMMLCRQFVVVEAPVGVKLQKAVGLYGGFRIVGMPTIRI